MPIQLIPLPILPDPFLKLGPGRIVVFSGSPVFTVEDRITPECGEVIAERRFTAIRMKQTGDTLAISTDAKQINLTRDQAMRTGFMAIVLDTGIVVVWQSITADIKAKLTTPDDELVVGW